MRSALSKESRDQAVRLSAPDLLNKTPTNTQDNFDKQVHKKSILTHFFKKSTHSDFSLLHYILKTKQKSDTNLYEMREALREAKAKVAACEEEGNKTLQQLLNAAGVKMRTCQENPLLTQLCTNSNPQSGISHAFVPTDTEDHAESDK